MIHVSHIITGLAPDGAERMMVNLLTRMDRARFTNEVISLTSLGDLGGELQAAGIRVRALGLGKSLGSLAKLGNLRRWLGDSPPDVVQTWMYHADLLGGLAARSAGVRRVFWGIHHSNLAWGNNKAATVLTARACALLSGVVPLRIVCCSEAARAAHGTFGYQDSKAEMIPNGFDTERYRPDAESHVSLRRELGCCDEDILIGMAARFHPDKDHANLLGAATRVLADHPRAMLVLCGSGVQEANPEFAALLRRFDLHDRVRLLGPIGRTERFFAGLDILVSPSRTEAFPLAVGEAMACGVPCVVTAVGDSALLVGDTGWAVPAKDQQALASALAKLITGSPELRQQLGRAARHRIQSLFSLDSVVQRYQDLYSLAMLPNAATSSSPVFL